MSNALDPHGFLAAVFRVIAMASPVPMYLYFARNAHGHIKIGVSRNPEKRVKRLQCNTGRSQGSDGAIELLATRKYPGEWEARTAERLFHGDFAEHRLNGEWFSANEKLAEVIELFQASGAEEAIERGQSWLSSSA